MDLIMKKTVKAPQHKKKDGSNQFHTYDQNSHLLGQRRSQDTIIDGV
jgi:hypothetical protein